ncbi:aspartate-semialdehyde dehydrogenase [Caminibacter mediatlanticus TB-2]|uniref:Aspartate-semialdehyde dehydrogenase n=1 Tax=Caminibacter mediatlanticus TB-2 TaxID=391592 RepID=A0ABX5VBJ7_9BACT|nr:aspartate-semialdehyde dehydrogenase [Caminibacter mediatlanticus]QCT94822.1 aspartate-semialdehyde dehydrogenase [Caminibacter mediatlanticus TB-2]
MYNVAIVGATGAVGEELFRVLEEYNFPVKKLVPLASARSVGKEVEFKGETLKVKELTCDVFEKEEIDIAFFSAGGSVSAKFAPCAVKAGAVVIDNTSYFRMDKDVPLVVPEVNPEDIALWRKKGIIANPNCSTIQMVISLAPLHKEFNIKRVEVATYQAVSGAGKKGMEELFEQMRAIFNFKLDKVVDEREVFQYQIALNVIPHIDKFMDNGFTREEMKMVNETNKIMHSNIEVAPTCVRVPVLRSHSEAITIHCEKEVDVKRAREVLESFEDIKVIDNPEKNEYPMPIIATDTDYVYVGRIRKDLFDNKTLHFFNVADQLRVGAATNAVRIALKWIEMEGEKFLKEKDK